MTTIDPDGYETENSIGTTPTYYQVFVPSFAELPSPSGITSMVTKVDSIGNLTYGPAPTLSGASSFLRLGSAPPSIDPTFTNSMNLAMLVGNVGGITSTQNILIGNGRINSNTYNDPNTSTLGPPGLTKFQDGFVDGSGIQTSAYGSNQDPNFLLGFADDVRSRGLPGAQDPSNTRISNSTVTNANQNRQAETLKLLTKGGWWDHSDGNRVTTTSGDKIEVIQGNYKLVVLGRQTVPSTPNPYVNMNNVLNTSPSLGSLLVAWDGIAKSASYNNVDTQWGTDKGAWYLVWGSAPSTAQITTQWTYNQFMSANTFVTDLSGGHFQEQYPSPTPCIKTIEYVQDAGGEWTLYQDNGIGNLVTKLKGRTVDMFQGSSREAYVGIDPSKDTSTTPGYTGAGLPNKDLDPVIISQTWAQSIATYVGSPGKWVPSIVSNTFAGAVVSNTSAGTINSSTDAAGDVASVTVAGGLVANVTSALDITNVTIADVLKVDVTVAPNTLEIVAGEKKLSVQLGNSLTFKIAGDVTVALAGSATFSLGASMAFENGKLVTSVSESQLKGVVNKVANVVNQINTSNATINNTNVKMSQADTNLSTAILLGL
jgi:hypothetical protein